MSAPLRAMELIAGVVSLRVGLEGLGTQEHQEEALDEITSIEARKVHQRFKKAKHKR